MKIIPPPPEPDLYSHKEICPGPPDCSHSDDEEKATEMKIETVSPRGVYCIAHTEKILFSQNVEFRTAELPRWKPRVVVYKKRASR